MTRMTHAKAAKKNLAPKTRNLSPNELNELREIQRMVTIERFKAEQVRQNTAIVPRGQEVANELDAMARLLENYKNAWMSQKIVDCGYPQGTQVSIDLATGKLERKV